LINNAKKENYRYDPINITTIEKYYVINIFHLNISIEKEDNNNKKEKK